MPQFAEQGGLVPESEGEVAAVRKVDAVGHQNVKMDVWLESRPEGLYGHDDSGFGLVALLPAVAMASNLSGHPASEDAVDQASDLTMEPSVQLEPLAQAHLLGQSDYEVAVVAPGSFSASEWLRTSARQLMQLGHTRVLQENGTAIWIWQSEQCNRVSQ